VCVFVLGFRRIVWVGFRLSAYVCVCVCMWYECVWRVCVNRCACMIFVWCVCVGVVCVGSMRCLSLCVRVVCVGWCV